MNTVFGPLVGEIVIGLGVILGPPLAAVLVGFLVRLAGKIGFQVEEGRRARLQEVIENGILATAAKADIALDGRLSFETRNRVIAGATDYLARHGAETLRKLRGDPKNMKLLEELVSGRGARLLGVSDRSFLGLANRSSWLTGKDEL